MKTRHPRASFAGFDTIARLRSRTPKSLLSLLAALILVCSTLTASAPLTSVAAAAPVGGNALVLINSASPSGADYATYIRPYLNQFGIPYTELDIASHALPADLSSYAVIIVGQRSLDPGGTLLDASEQAAITAAVHAGAGLVNFDNDLFSGSTPRYSFINSIFGFGHGGPTSGGDVTIGAVPHYITSLHTSEEVISTTSDMTLAGITAPAGVNVIATSGGAPFLAVTTYGTGNAVQFASYDWMSYSVLGPLKGLDDLVWRAVVWAARKPFVMRGMPPFVTMRMDDVSDPLTWIPAANAAGFIPWAGVFTSDIDATEAVGLSALAAAGKATVGLHAFGTSDFFYFDHNNGTNFSDAQMAANYAAGSAWFAANNIPISKYLVPHYYEIGSNAFAGLSSWGVSCVGTMMDPGSLEASAPWMSAGPFRATQSGQAYDRSANPYYSDFMTIPGHPEYNGQFFNLMTEIRDITGYEWQPSSDVAASVATGTAWLTRPIDGMELATLFSHEYMLPNNGVSSAAWSATMNGIAANLAPYNPIYISMDQACAYTRALSTSRLASASYDSGSNTVTANFTGSAPVATKFYVFNNTSGGAISQTLVDAPSFSSGTAVNYTLPGPLNHIAITPNPGSVAAGATLAFSASGFDAANNPIPNLTYAWSVTAGGGSIDASGHFTAGSATGNFPNTVTATSGGVSAKASVSVTTPVFDHFTFASIGSPKFVNAPFTISISARDAGGNLVPGYVGTAALSVSTGTVSPTTMTFVGGIAAGPISLSATGSGLTLSLNDSGKTGTSNSFDVTAATACPCSIWPDTTIPATGAVTDNQAINLGLKFRATIDGYVAGVRFYKGAANTGTHTGYLWTANGTQLATVTFSGESASGWQTAYFDAPVAVNADTTYVVSYYSPSGYFALTNSGLASGVSTPPLRALADGEDGPNALFHYGAAGFPTSNYQGSNYWVDVVFATSVGPDTTPPTIVSLSPGNGASGVAVNAPIGVTFNEPLAAGTVNASTLVLRDAGNNLVPSSVSYNVASRTATLTPNANLAYSGTYSATISGGASGVTDLAGNPLAADRTWTFSTAATPPPPADQGPGGPILIVTASGDPYGRYYTEILRAEGLDEFLAADISTVNASTLANYQDVILAPMSLSAGQVSMFTNYVNAGGNLVAMRPDAQLASLLGLSSAAGNLSNAYLLVDTSKAPGAGLVAQTIQFHGTADNYALAGATSVAALYTNASSATTNPAVTMRSVGSNGGHAGAFTFDLARSVVGLRQGNPALAGQYLDGATDLSRADNMFQQGWLDMNKVAIPQADEQQRLLANLLAAMNAGGAPQPRFWYFPHGYKAVVIMTGDDHGSGGTAGRFDIYLANSTAGCSVSDWTCIRSTSYVEGNNMTDAQAAAYVAAGFEVGVHISTNCADWTPAQLAADYTDQIATWHTWFPSLPSPVSNRTHCIAWSDYATQPAVELSNGIRIDLNYYYWPSSWLQDRPGMFTGSGMPMRFADANGNMIDVYQATTQMTDESGQSYPYNIDTLLDNALGSNQYFGAFAANMHTDSADSAGSSAIIASAQARGVPVVSAAQMLTWLDGRNASSFASQSWTSDGSGGKVLSFTVAAGSGANGLQTMLPMTSSAGSLKTITRGGSPVSFTSQIINGINYAFFDSAGGTYLADYGQNANPLTISALLASPKGDGTATISWTTDRPSDSSVNYGTSAASLIENSADSALATSHSVTLTGLSANTKYYFRVTSTDASTVSATMPVSGDSPDSFTTPAAALTDTTVTDFSAGSGLCLIDNEFGNGEVSLAPALNEDFSGTTLSGAWSVNNWGSGSASVAAGSLTVDGVAGVSNASYGAGSALDFVATFPVATPFTHVGFAGSNPPFNDAPWAIFSTGTTGTALQARVWVVGGSFLDYTIPGSYLGASHHYRIEWTPTAINFLIDGVLVHSQPAVITGTMVVGASDYNTGGANPTVDWLRVSPYSSPCVFTSRVLDAGGPATWTTASANIDLPAGTALGLEVRTGNSATPDGTWSVFVPLINGDSVGASGRYLQYRATLSSTDPSVTPLLRDISFAYSSTPDTTPPLITALAATAHNDGTATITWTTDEPSDSAISYGTAQGSLTLIGSDSTLVLSHSLTLTGLSPNQTYYYRVSSTDAGTNTASAPALPAPPASFTTPSANLVDTTVADFGAGTPDAGVTIANTTGGELTLLAPINETFAGSALPTGWSAKSTPWDNGGTATVSGGQLAVDGTMVGTNTTFGPGHSLTFTATFGAQKFEHVGFVADLEFSDPWAIISTGSNGDGVYARTSSGTQTSLGAGLLGTSHSYRIDWTASGFAFWVDGSLIITIPFVTSGPMLVGVSDAVSGTPLIVDSLAMGPYAATGTFLSRVFDGGSVVSWSSLSWDATTPAGTGVAFAYRAGNTSAPDTSWTPWIAVTTPGTLGVTARYIQYRAILSSADGSNAPVVNSVTFAYGTGGDSTPPTIVSRSPASGDTGIATNSSVTVAFSEPLDPASIAGNLRLRQNGSSADVPATVTLNGATLTLNPGVALTNGANYTVSLGAGLADLAGNTIGAPATWSFRVVALSTSLYDDIISGQFGAGSPDAGVTVSGLAGGELILSPTVEAEFSSNSLPAAWTTGDWTGGAVTVSGGALHVDGAIAHAPGSGAPSAGAPLRSLSFVATFGAATFQNAGFGQDLNLTSEQWALFGTANSTGTVFARTNTGSGSSDVAVGTTGAAHLYRIDWTASAINYYIDGTLVYTASAAISAAMAPLVSDYSAGGPDLSVNWLRLSPYASIGTFTSRVFDAIGPVTWGTLNVNSDIPAGTNATFETRSGYSATPDASWSAWAALGAGQAIASPSGRYIQYQVTLSSVDPGLTPTIYSVSLGNELLSLPLIAWDNSAPIAYGTALGGDQLNAVANVPGSFVYNPPAGTVLNAGGGQSLSATFTPTDPSYSVVSTSVSLTVTPATLTVTAEHKTKLYGTANPDFTYALGGFVHGDTSSVVGGAPLLSSLADGSSAVGDYPIAIDLHTLAADNYGFSAIVGSLSVSAAPQVITFVQPMDKTYGDAIFYPGATASSGLDVTYSASGACSVFGTGLALNSAGTCNVTAHQGGSGNYAAAPDVTRSFTVAPAVLTVSADNQIKTYGGDNPILTYTYHGLVNGDSAVNLEAAPICSTSATSASPVGFYPITCAGGLSGNYTFVYVDGTLTVIAATLDHLVLSPADAVLTVGASQTYSATGFDAYGNNLGDLSPGTIFSIDGNPCAERSCTSSVAGDHLIVGVIGGVRGTATAHFSGLLGTTYHPLAPVRLVDSRINYGLTLLHSGVPQTFTVAGRAGIPANAVAITGNVVSVNATHGGYFSLTTAPIATPSTSTLNFPVGDIRANNVTMALSGDGAISAVYVGVPGASANIVFDVTGYFTNDTSGATYHPLSSVRLVDSRQNYGLTTLHSSLPQTFTVAGRAGIPANAVAITGNVVSVNATHGGFFSLTTAPASTPGTSTLNFPVGDIRANGLTMALGAGGTISVVYVGVPGSSADIVFDVTGYFTADLSGAAYHPLTPVRLVDSRVNYGLTKLVSHVPQVLSVSGQVGVPASASAITGNVVSVNATVGGFFSLTSAPTSTPSTSTLNFPAGDIRANGLTTTLSGGTLSVVYVGGAGSADIVLDITGYFLAASGG
jgi:hypothetical protein